MKALFAGLVASIVLAGVAAPSIAQDLPSIPAVTRGWRDKVWVHPDGTRFHYLEMGRGTPVILIHGSGGTATNWIANGLGAAVAKTNKVYAIDMRGHGQTVGTDGKRQARTPNMDLDVLAFMDAHGIKKAHIGGFSMGGSITSQLMARAPERFITAHFGGSGVSEPAGSPFAAMVPADKEGPAPMDVRAREIYLARQAAEAAKVGVVNAATGPAALSSQPTPAAVPRPPLDLTKIDFPVLAVIGEYDRPYARTHRLWREVKNFRRVILANRGHLSSYIAGMAPALYRDELTDFIVSHNP